MPARKAVPVQPAEKNFTYIVDDTHNGYIGMTVFSGATHEQADAKFVAAAQGDYLEALYGEMPAADDFQNYPEDITIIRVAGEGVELRAKSEGIKLVPR